MNESYKKRPIVSVVCSITETKTKDYGTVNDNVVLGGINGPYASRTTDVSNIKHYFDTDHPGVICFKYESAPMYTVYHRLKAALKHVLPEYDDNQWLKTKLVNKKAIESLHYTDTKIDCFFYVEGEEEGKSVYKNVLRTSFSCVDMGDKNTAKKEIFQTPSIYATKTVDENNKIELNIPENVNVDVMDGESVVFKLLTGIDNDDDINYAARQAMFAFEVIDLDRLQYGLSDEDIDRFLVPFNIPKDERYKYKTGNNSDNLLSFIKIAIEVRKVIPIVFCEFTDIANKIAELYPSITVFTMTDRK